MRQLVYTMFITNNHDSFHLWWKEHLAKHQKVQKYYDQDCSYINLSDVFHLYSRLCEVRNSRVTKSSYETELHKMTSHFELLTRKFL